MKYLLTWLVWFVCANLCGGQNLRSEDYGARIVISGEGGLSNLEFPQGAKVSSFEKKTNQGVKRYTSIQCRKVDSSKWERLSVAFTPCAGGEFCVALSGAVARDSRGEPKKLSVYYDDVRVNGKPIPNGGFENGMKGWNTTPSSKIVYGSAYEGDIALRARWCADAMRRFSLKKGERFEISVMARPVGDTSEVCDDIALDFSKYTNSVFCPSLDVSSGTLEFLGVKFCVPTHRGKYSTAFRHPSNKKLPSRIFFDYSKKCIGGKYLYVLYSQSNPDNAKKQAVGHITIKTRDGSETKTTIICGVNISCRDNPRKISTAKRVWSSDGKFKKDVLYMTRIPLPSATPLEYIFFASYSESGRKLEVVGATLSDTDVMTIEKWTPNTDGWTRVDMAENLETIEGSALDMSGLFDKSPAGATGRLIVSERGTFAFEKEPQKDVRFKGFTYCPLSLLKIENRAERERAIDSFVGLLKRNGYNYLRISIDYLKGWKVREKKAEMFDRVDYLLSKLKRGGIYIHLPLMWYESGEKDYVWELHDDVKVRTVFGEPNAWKLWRETALEQLEHINPYTGVAWKDDPMFAVVEYYNELSICFPRIMRGDKRTIAFVLEKFKLFLENKYGNFDAFKIAWTAKDSPARVEKFNCNSFSEVDYSIFRLSHPDWLEFCWENKRRFVDYAQGIVRNAGYKGLSAQTNMQSVPYANDLRSEYCDVILKNSYFAHPSNFSRNDVSCPQGSSLESKSFWLSVASSREFNRPMGITEYNHCFWNKYRYEMPSLIAPYAAFQNFSFLIIHADSVYVHAVNGTGRRTMNPFAIKYSPTMRAGEIFSSCFFLRGDVDVSKHRVDLLLDKNYAQKGALKQRAINPEQVAVSYMTGFATHCRKSPRAALKKVRVSSADIEIKPSGSADLKTEAWFQEIEGGGGFDMSDFVEQMRAKGVLPKGNATDAARQYYESDTGQLAIDILRKTVRAITPKSVMMSAEKFEPVTLGALRILSSTVPAAVGVCSVDGMEIEKSSRLVLAYCTREANADMVLSEDLTYAATYGNGSVMMQNGILRAEVKLDSRKSYAVYPLSLNGLRRAPIVPKFADGVMSLEIDNSKLPDGATSLFEIVAK